MLGLSVFSENSWCIDCASYFCLILFERNVDNEHN